MGQEFRLNFLLQLWYYSGMLLYICSGKHQVFKMMDLLKSSNFYLCIVSVCLCSQISYVLGHNTVNILKY